jgi:hypothetical protein
MYHETECGCEQHAHGGGPGMGHGGEWGHHGHGGWGSMHHSGGCCCGCGCHHGGGMHHGPDFGLFGHRRFISKEEVITHLEEYLKQLKAEAAGVEEHIAELKKEQ